MSIPYTPKQHYAIFGYYPNSRIQATVDHDTAGSAIPLEALIRHALGRMVCLQKITIKGVKVQRNHIRRYPSFQINGDSEKLGYENAVAAVVAAIRARESEGAK